MTTTGQTAWWTTWLLTEPITSLANPPLPRDPTTSRSPRREALMSSSAALPVHTSTVTSGTVSPMSLATLSTKCWTSCRDCSRSRTPSGTTEGPVMYVDDVDVAAGITQPSTWPVEQIQAVQDGIPV